MGDLTNIETFIQSSPHPAWLANSKGECVYANAALVRLIGLNSDQINQVDWWNFLLEEDRVAATASWRKSLANGRPCRARVRMRGFDGVPATVELIAFGNKLTDDMEEPWLFIGLRVDSAFHQNASLEAQLQATLNVIPAYTWYAAPSGGLTFVNQRTADYLGLPKDHPLRFGIAVAAPWDSHLPFLHPNDREETRRVWSNCLRTGSAGEASFRVRDSEGGYCWFLSRAEPLRAGDGTLLYWIGVNLDIQERKQAEFYLAEGQRLAHTGSWAFNPSGFFDYWSRELFQIYGLDPSNKPPTLDEYLGLIHAEDRESMAATIQRMLAESLGCDLKKRIVRPDGELRYIRCVGVPVVSNGILKSIVGTAMDVTEQEHLTQELRRREAYLAEAQKLSHTGSFGWNVCSGEIHWSRETFRIFEYEPTAKASIELIMQRTHPEDRLAVQQLIDRVSRERTEFDFEHRLLMLDGSVKYLHVVGSPSENEDGCFEFVGAVTDITAAKQAEQALRESEAYLAEAQRLTHMGSWAWRVAGRDTVHLSEEWYRIYGFDPEEGVLGWEKRLQRVHPEDRAKWQGVIERAVDEKSDYEMEYRILLPGGTVKYIHTVGHPVLNASGDLVQFVGSVMDITERKQAEERIREQEIELRQILDLAPQHVLVLGPDQSHLYVNQAALNYFGLKLEQWRSCDLQGLIHPDDRERAISERQNAYLKGSSHENEERLRRSDGNYRWFLVRRNPLRDEQGRVMRWYITGTDIEDRKQAEQRLQHENVALREEIDNASMFEEIVGTSIALQTVLSRVSKVAPTDSTVLITGETGTGKELVARAIHRRSRRSSRAFVSVNCAAIPRDLIASELFGHEKGAFTGATQQRLGRFEMAEGGTIFLDEVGELPAETQIALLRVLQEHEFERVGGCRSIQTDVRVIAATNRDLQAAIAGGTFRSDLFYRLHVFPIEIPSLRERREDIPMLVEYFIDRYARKAGKSITGVSKKTLDLLQSYPWPGNIRELQNVIERSVIVCETENFSVDESWLSRQPLATAVPKSPLDLSQKLVAQEKEMIEAALRECGGQVFGPSGAAAKLGMPRSTLESKIRSLKINKNRFKTAASSESD